MAAAIWSSKLDDVMSFPAQTFVRFFQNHGLFSLGARPQWRSVLGGSRRYVEALSAPFRNGPWFSKKRTKVRAGKPRMSSSLEDHMAAAMGSRWRRAKTSE